MDEKRMIELLTRKLAGEASKEELFELNELIVKYPDTLHTEEIFDHIWNAKVDDEDTSIFYERHKLKHRLQFDDSEDKNSDVIFNEPIKKPKRFLLTGSAVLITLLVSGYMLFFQPGKASKTPVYTQIISGKGIRKTITLPDGTKVFLNADSRLSYDADMTKNSTRLVTLAGEAFFDVVHLEGRPFIIHTNKISIKVLGTSFNVKAYPGDSKCETTLIRGSIELSTNDGTKQQFILKPSEKLSLINAGNHKVNGRKNDSSTLLIENIAPVKFADKEYLSETSWTENKLIFENKTLAELAPELERWFNVKILITGQEIAANRFTGAFANETIEQALTAMKLIKPFNFKIHEKNITIY